MIEVTLAHNKRTAEFKYKANRDRAFAIPNMLRSLYGKDYKVQSLEVDEYTHIVALVGLGNHPVPTKTLRAVPNLIEGFLVGFDIGFMEGMQAKNPEKLWDKPPKDKLDIYFSPN